MIKPTDFKSMSTSRWKSDSYNTHRVIGEHTVSISYGGICYGKGFFKKNDGQLDGTFEVCVWNNETDETMSDDDGNDVTGWMSLEQVNNLLLQLS